MAQQRTFTAAETGPRRHSLVQTYSTPGGARPCTSSPGSTPSAWANFKMFTRLTLRSPRSNEETYVG